MKHKLFMTNLSYKSEVNTYISTVGAVLIYFSSKDCSVCKVLKSKIENATSENFPKINMFEVKTDVNKEIASNFSVFTFPTIIVFFDSKEFKRYGRNISIPKFSEELKRPYNLFFT